MADSPLQKRYAAEVDQLRKDNEFLETRTDEYDDRIKDIVKLSLPSDEDYAQTVVNANTFLGQAVAFGSEASGCGCSITIAIGSTVYYEVARADMENASTDDYNGNDPQGDNGTVALTSGSGESTVLVQTNFGKGVSLSIGVGASAIFLGISTVQPNPGICATITCSEYYTLQNDAITNYNNAKSLVARETADNKSSKIKAEAKEYRLQRWANEKGKKFTQDRIDRIDAFYPETE
jgi:hypothetical protein